MNVDLRWLVVTLFNLVLVLLVQMINHALGAQALTLYPFGLIAAYAAIYLPIRQALAVCLLSGLFIDATLPLPFGWTFTALACLACPVLILRRKRMRDFPALLISTAILCNAAMIMALSLWFWPRELPASGYGLNLLVTLALGTAGVALLTPWYRALLNGLLTLVPARLDHHHD